MVTEKCGVVKQDNPTLVWQRILPSSLQPLREPVSPQEPWGFLPFSPPRHFRKWRALALRQKPRPSARLRHSRRPLAPPPLLFSEAIFAARQIGRASRRERGEIS